MANFREKLRYVDGASGMAVAIGKKIVAVDVFDKPSTCGKVWDRLMSGYVLDALEPQTAEGQAEAIDVEQLLGSTNGLAWEKAEPVGEGEEYRAQQGDEVHASALAFHDAPVHVSRLMSGYVLDALEPQANGAKPRPSTWSGLLGSAKGLAWEKAEPVGEGEEYRAQQGEEVHASALAFHDAPVHVSVVVAG